MLASTDALEVDHDAVLGHLDAALDGLGRDEIQPAKLVVVAVEAPRVVRRAVLAQRQVLELGEGGHGEVW